MAFSKSKLIIIFLLLTSTLSAKSIHTKLSDRIYKKYNKELVRTKKVFLTGSGGSFCDGVKKIFANYTSFECLSIAEVRSLFIEIAEGYLARYNQNEEIRPYLNNYPFTIENLNVSIGFEDESRKLRSEGKVAYVFVSERTGELVFCTHDNEQDMLVDLYREPYAVAREIVMKEKNISTQ